MKGTLALEVIGAGDTRPDLFPGLLISCNIPDTDCPFLSPRSMSK